MGTKFGTLYVLTDGPITMICLLKKYVEVTFFLYMYN